MSDWNYRLMRYEADKTVGIHEVFYDENGFVDAWTKQPILALEQPTRENFDKIIEQLKVAFDKPVLDWDAGEE